MFTHFEESINVPNSWDEIRDKGLQFVVKLYRLRSVSEGNSHSINTSKNPWDIDNSNKCASTTSTVYVFFFVLYEGHIIIVYYLNITLYIINLILYYSFEINYIKQHHCASSCNFIKLKSVKILF